MNSLWKLSMTSRKFLALFNDQSWRDFRDNGANIYGTTKNKLNRAKKIHLGDTLLCYVSKRSVFSGVLKINSEVYYNESECWTKGVFPVRFNVIPEYLLNLDDSISISILKEHLKIFRNLKDESNWAGFFINAFNEFPREDGDYIINLIKSKASNMT